MSLTDDDVLLAEQLKGALLARELDGPGPDLVSVRRRGARRRRRHQAAVGTGAALLVLGVGAIGALGLDGRPADRLGSAGTTAGGAQAAPPIADPAAVTAVLHDALDSAGIPHPGAPTGRIVHVEDGGEVVRGWLLRWDVPTGTPRTEVEFIVRPSGPDGVPPSAYPCAESPALTRACTDRTLPSGVRILAGESSGHTVTDADGAGAQGAAMWSPTAMAIHPDGRQVTLSIGLSSEQPNPPGVPAPVYEYSAGITLDQLRTAVSSPALARLATG